MYYLFIVLDETIVIIMRSIVGVKQPKATSEGRKI